MGEDRIRLIDALRGLSLGGSGALAGGRWRRRARDRPVPRDTGFRAKWEFQFGFFGRGFQTFGLFLLGLWAGRRRVFEDIEAHRRLFGRIWQWTGALTLLFPLIGGVLFAVALAMGSAGYFLMRQ